MFRGTKNILALSGFYKKWISYIVGSTLFYKLIYEASMLNAFALTIIFVVATTLIAAFVRGRIKDRCLKDFSGSLITLQDTANRLMWGSLRVESTGLELVYADAHKDTKGHKRPAISYTNKSIPRLKLWFAIMTNWITRQNKKEKVN